MNGSDRPLSRRIIKLGFSLFAGRARAHGQDVWPGLAIDRASGRISYKGQEAGRLAAGGLPAGLEEITIVGSGPSIKGQDLGRLAPQSAVLLNGAISLADQLPPLALAVEDERFVWRHGDMLQRAPSECLWMLSPAVIRALLSLNPQALKGRSVVLIDNLLKPLGLPRRRADAPELAAFTRAAGGAALSLDPARGIMPAGTVAYSALQFALAARPKRIGLAGIDLSNANAPRFYEQAGQAAASGIVTGLPRILAGFALARTVAEEAGIETCCYSAVSALLGLGYAASDRLERRAT